MKAQEKNYRPIAQNRQARFHYSILEELEAGLVLCGSEVKSLRQGRASLGEAHAGEMGGELYLFNMTISEYPGANRFNHEPKRPRKLLLRRRQMNKWIGAAQRKGMTLVPLVLYFNHKGLVKVCLGLAKGKNVIDKRETLKERDWKRDQARLLRNQ